MFNPRKLFVLGFILTLPWSAVASGKIQILTSIFPLREFAAAVVGERGGADQLLPPGAGVHTWQPKPRDIMRLASADLFIAVGSGLEPWLSDVVGAVPGGKLRVLEVSRGMALLRVKDEERDEPPDATDHGRVDPHIWLDFGLDEVAADRIVAALSEIDPSSAGYFRQNAAALKERLRQLDIRFSEGLKSCAGKQIVVAGHAAFGYLAHRYGLVQTALYGLSPDSQPRPQQMMRVIEFCRREKIRTVFFENSVPPGLAWTLAAEIGGHVAVLCAGHNLTRDQMLKGVGFFDMMEENLRALREGLGCR
jgi:zinc transport system substrate-binding protein